jgi:hypothetical protein
LELFMRGRPQSVARIVKFNFPLEYATPDLDEVPSGSELMASLKKGDMIAVEPRTSQFKRIHVARVERTFIDQLVAEVLLYHIPKTARYGPWEKRTWEVWLNDNAEPRREVITQSEIVCRVTLVEHALDRTSLAALAIHGIDTGRQPRRDHSLPPRTV